MLVLLAGGELGNETYIGLILLSPALSQTSSILIENDVFFRSECQKVGVVDISRIYGEIESGKKTCIEFSLKTYTR